MKRFLPILPLTLFLLLNACASGTVQASSDMWYLFGLTLTATQWTPVSTQTYNANIPTMINWLNADLSSTNPLERSLDAEYQVIDVSFPNGTDSPLMIFRVDVKCKCVNSDECCFPERTFVVIIEAMKRNGTTFSTLVPGEVSEIIVVCYNHQTPVAAVSAPWQEAKAYLQGYLTGYQLAPRVIRTAVPQ